MHSLVVDLQASNEAWIWDLLLDRCELSVEVWSERGKCGVRVFPLLFTNQYSFHTHPIFVLQKCSSFLYLLFGTITLRNLIIFCAHFPAILCVTKWRHNNFKNYFVYVDCAPKNSNQWANFVVCLEASIRPQNPLVPAWWPRLFSSQKWFKLTIKKINAHHIIDDCVLILKYTLVLLKIYLSRFSIF